MASLLLCLLLAAAPASAQSPAPTADSKPAAAPRKKPEASQKKKASGPKKARAAQAPAAPDAGTPQPRPPFKWDVPGIISWVESPGLQVTDGVPMHLQLARSNWELNKLIQHMADRFRASGLFIPTSPQALTSPVSEPMLTALDTEKLTAYTVIFQPNPDKTVTIILGTSDLSNYTPGGISQLDWAPVMPGAQQVTRSNLEGTQMALYAIQSTPDKVLEFYRVELGRAGFTEDKEQPGLFQKGTERLSIRTHQDSEGLMVGLSRKLGVQPE
ncbi:MAG TPA: hypothetical protein VE153_38690 [Myxococcus sp.]|nr:hypothetical protein [Myxococcus sp.]